MSKILMPKDFVDGKRFAPSELRKGLGASVSTALAAICIGLIMALPW